MSNESCEFGASEDVTLAFVFHYEQLDKIAYIQGMGNVYLVSSAL